MIQINIVEEARDASFRIPLVVGERAVLELWTNRATGADWRIDTHASKGFNFVQVKPGRIYDPSDPTDWRLRDRGGTPVLQEWRIEAIQPGRAHIMLSYGPAWRKHIVHRQATIDAVTSDKN